MRKSIRNFFLGLLLTALLSLTANAQATSAANGRLITVNSREGGKISYWWMPHPQATQTVLLFAGGGGGMGYKNGLPQSENFLVRSRDLFFEQGFNVAILGNPSDMRDMPAPYVWRTSKQHADDVLAVMNDFPKSNQQPLWLVGTSAGTISVAALGPQLQERLAGLVLTASVTTYQWSTGIPKLNIEPIRLPVLLYHHQDDACQWTQARELSWISKKLTNAALVKTMVVTGGANPTGHPCEALHWHGFIGMEKQAVQDISTWIKNPQP